MSHQNSARTKAVTVVKARRSPPPVSTNPTPIQPDVMGIIEVKEALNTAKDDATVQPAAEAAHAPNDHQIEERMAKIEEILGYIQMRLLDRCEIIAEWVRHAEAKVSRQLVQKPGRPEGGVAMASRSLPLSGKSEGARRKIVERAVKVAAMYPHAKDEARKVRCDDTQKALIEIAEQPSLALQLAKVARIADRKPVPGRKPTGRKPENGVGDTHHSSPQANTSTGITELSAAGSLDEPSEGARLGSIRANGHVGERCRSSARRLGSRLPRRSPSFRS